MSVLIWITMLDDDLKITEPSNRRLLIIEDNTVDVDQYMRLLEAIELKFDHIECAHRLDEGREILIKNPPTCCLLDNFLPDGSAKEFLESIHTDDAPSLCPIIVITGQEDITTAINLMHIGAQDYLVKQDLDAPQLERAMFNAIKTWTLQSQLNHLALYDSLTGLANRALFINRTSQLFEESRRYSHSFALMCLDLDHFKAINDTFGHEAGDQVLIEVGERLKSLLRITDTIARLGGDEFAILLPEISEEKANYVALKIILALGFEFSWNNFDISISASIGLTTLQSKTDSYKDMMREADIALYRAKKNGRRQYSAFSKRFEQEIKAKEALALVLPKALKDNKFQVAWQPIFDVNDKSVVSVEALVRWKYNEQWIPPPRIIDIILEHQLGDIFHEWLFNHTLKQLSHWHITHPTIKIAFNLPANLCHDKRIIQSLLTAMNTHSIPHEHIIVEITETHLMCYPDETRKQLVILSQMGIEIAIDDFGTGYSSMQYLASLPCNTLKIDQSFFLTLTDNPRNQQIVEAITALAHRLDLNVVAEGIETEELFKAVKEFKCDFAQGYWLGAPVITESPFLEFCKESKIEGHKMIAKFANKNKKITL